MKKETVFHALMIATVLAMGAGSGSRVIAAQAQAPAQQASPWKDRAEYDAYNLIEQAKEPNQRVELADKYLAAYPESKVAERVHAIKLQAYQQLNNTPKTEEAATKVLEINPKNFQALFLLSYLIPRTSLNAQDPGTEKKLTAAADYAKRGLEQLECLPLPQGMAPEEFQKQKNQSAAVFHQTAGFVALQMKEYEQAEQALRKSSEMNPNDALGFYWLGLAELSPKPAKYDPGIWAMARAISITGPTALPAATQQQVKEYLTKLYDARHGSDEGMEQLLAQAAAAPFPPADFHVKSVEEIAAEAPPEPEAPPPPVARELSVKAEELNSFDVIEKYLQAGGEKEADTWELLKGASLPLPGKVIAATPAARPKTIQVAVSPELQAQEGKFDVELTLAAPHSKALAKGQMIQFEGTVDSYRAKPFLLRLTEGKITP